MTAPMAETRMPRPGEFRNPAAVTRRALSVPLHTNEEIDELIARLDSPTRATPTVIVSTRNSGQMLGVSPRKLADRLGDRATVYVVTTAALAWRLDRRPEYRTYGGAIRVVGAAGSGEVIRTDRDPANVIDRVSDAVDAEIRRMSSRPRTGGIPGPALPAPCLTPAPTPLDVLRRRAAHPADAPLDTDPQTVHDGPDARPQTPVGDSEIERLRRGVELLNDAVEAGRRAVSHLREELSESQQIVVRLEAELDSEREARTSAEHRAAAATRELTAARAEIERLRAELGSEHSPLFSDPEEQFRDDVQRTWLRTVSESERKNYPLRGFRLGPEFLGSLNIPQAPRAKIVEVVVDVLTRRARDGVTGGAPARRQWPGRRRRSDCPQRRRDRIPRQHPQQHPTGAAADVVGADRRHRRARPRRPP